MRWVLKASLETLVSLGHLAFREAKPVNSYSCQGIAFLPLGRQVLYGVDSQDSAKQVIPYPRASIRRLCESSRTVT